MPGGPVRVTSRVWGRASIPIADSSSSRPTNRSADCGRPLLDARLASRIRPSRPVAYSCSQEAIPEHTKIHRRPPLLAGSDCGRSSRTSHVGGFPDTAMTARTRTTGPWQQPTGHRSASTVPRRARERAGRCYSWPGPRRRIVASTRSASGSGTLGGHSERFYPGQDAGRCGDHAIAGAGAGSPRPRRLASGPPRVPRPRRRTRTTSAGSPGPVPMR